MIKGDLQPFSIQEIGIYEDAVYFIPNGSHPQSKVEIKLEEKKNRQSLSEAQGSKEKEKEKDREIQDQSSGDDVELVAFRPPNPSPRSGGRITQRARGQGRASLERNMAPIYLNPVSSSDEESDIRGARIPFDYQKINPSPKFDLTLDSDSDPEVDAPKVKNDKSELTMYEKLSRRIEAISLAPLSAGRIVGLEIKEARNLHSEVGKVQKFFSGSSSSRDEGDVTLEEADFNELMELPFGYFPVCVKNSFFEGTVPYRWTKGQARYHKKIWQTKIPKKMLQVELVLEPPKSSRRAVFGDLDDPDELQVWDAPPEFEKEFKSTVDELREVNLGTKDDPRPTFISTFLSKDESRDLIQLLSEFRNCFAWIYNEIQGLSPNIAVHKLGIRFDAIPVKQAPRRMRLEIKQQFVFEIKKLAEAGFIREEQYPSWVASVVPV